ncbi:2882_t:CDS:2, partial [Funneliformis geosporum]
MNANTFLTNISRSLSSLEKQNDSLSEAIDENESKLEEIHKSITDVSTLIQQQNISVNNQINFIKEDISQLKSEQNNILDKINEVLLKVENSSNNQSRFLTKSCRRKKFKSVDDLLGSNSESEAANDKKLNPYDLTPTLVALIRNRMKENEQDSKDSNDESIENEFSFNYSKSFTHKVNQKVLKAYYSFYIKDYKTRGDNLKKSKTIKINNRRKNRTLKKFNARNNAIDTFDTEILGHPIKEVRRNDKAIKVRDIVDSKVEQQRQAKSRKGSAISPNKARFRQLSSFIPAYPTSLNFLRWAIKTSYDLNTILSNAIDSDSEYEVQNISNPTSRMNINSNERNPVIKFAEKSLLNNIYKDINFESTDDNDSQ